MPGRLQSRLSRSATPRLSVVLNGVLAGQVYSANNRRLTFRYEDAWRLTPGAFPLSVSMPLDAAEHGHRATSAYLWGLLPDNPEIIAQWGRVFSVARYDVLRLLERVGEDCAGAVQLVPPDSAASLLGAPTATDARGSIEWLSRDDVAALLEGLRRNPAAGRSNAEQGQFSLAGAQPKTALYRDEHGRWGIPRGRTPSSCILKPPVLALDDLAYNEHASLRLAQELGIAAVATSVERFGDEVAIVVDRYDRVGKGGVLRRLHQEDMCQALAVQPTRKYESEGGPGAIEVLTVLARHSDAAMDDTLRFVDALAFNWLIAGTDAHAKNYALLHAAGPQSRLAPLYDVISALPYPSMMNGTARLAMAVDGESSIERIARSHWRALARAVGISEDAVVDRIIAMAGQVPDAIERVCAREVTSKEAAVAIERMLRPVERHARRCAKRMR